MWIAISNIADKLNSNLKGFFMPKVPKCGGPLGVGHCYGAEPLVTTTSSL